MHRIQCNVWDAMWIKVGQIHLRFRTLLYFFFLLLIETLIHCCHIYCETTREKIEIIDKNVQYDASGKLKGQYSAALKRTTIVIWQIFSSLIRTTWFDSTKILAQFWSREQYFSLGLGIIRFVQYFIRQVCTLNLLSLYLHIYLILQRISISFRAKLFIQF